MVRINDTTLRDGEQAPFVAFNTKEKIEIAQLLFEAGTDEIEVGIPAMGKKEREDIKEIVSLKLPIPLMTWNRATMSDLESSLDCGVNSVDLSIPTSDVLINVKYKGDKAKLLKNLEQVILSAKKENLIVCIGGEDSSRANIDFLKEVFIMGAELGVDRFRYCDTVGILTPMQTFKNILELKKLNLLEIEMHTHNDFGMATANAIAGIEAGATSVNTTVIGLGERAGNASFEQVLMSLTHQFNEHRKIDATMLTKLVNKVSIAANKPIDDNLPIVGAHIFSHESGIHTNAMMKNTSSYEAFCPEEVGLFRNYPIGKHSGTSTLDYHLSSFGIHASKRKLTSLLPKIREIVTMRKQVLEPFELRELYLCS
ncbi:Homocitrate synthase [Sulfurovum sp. enrichment culture clone C5]|uniref:Homocitrate synthase n=1 Tax=Sulfurovum sp. enrichment culture clone C5 TaxID=497650 RepID=A0A0S4XQH0_9BACT|nr:Homocitrate synthase [Sulfurovum sp. enrichment culture clone C5]